MSAIIRDSYTKLGNVFQYTTLFRGIAAQISPKLSFRPTTIRLEGELCSSEFGRKCPILDFLRLKMPYPHLTSAHLNINALI